MRTSNVCIRYNRGRLSLSFVPSPTCSFEGYTPTPWTRTPDYAAIKPSCSLVYTTQHYPDKLRRIKYHATETDKRFVFLTNNFSLPALTFTERYRSRWQIELFFKWIKQHLHIKPFFGTSENAVKAQVWIVRLCAGRHHQEAIQYPGQSLFDSTDFESERFRNNAYRSTTYRMPSKYE
jgi:hypothetical protein